MPAGLSERSWLATTTELALIGGSRTTSGSWNWSCRIPYPLSTMASWTSSGPRWAGGAAFSPCSWVPRVVWIGTTWNRWKVGQNHHPSLLRVPRKALLTNINTEYKNICKAKILNWMVSMKKKARLQARVKMPTWDEYLSFVTREENMGPTLRCIP